MKKRSRTEFSILNSITGISGYFVDSILGFVCRMVFVRCLADDYLGINGLLTNILSMLSLAELGVGGAIVYALYEPLEKKDYDKIASLMHSFKIAYSIIGCVIFALGLCALPFFGLLIKETPNIIEDIRLIYILFLFRTSISYFFSYKASLLTASQRHYLVAGTSYIFTILQSIVQIVFLVLTRKYIVYLVIGIVGGIAYSLLISHIAEKLFPVIKSKGKPLNREDVKKITRNVKALTIGKFGGVLVNNVDNIIITYFSGLVSVGYASNYTLFTTTLNSLINSLFNGLTASVGNFSVMESDERKLSLFNSLNLVNFWAFGWGAIGIFLVSGDLVNLFYGDRFVLQNSIPFVLALNFYMVGMQNAVWTFKSALGLFPYGQYLLFITAGLNLVFSIALGKIWGLFGIFIATAISRGFTNTWYDPYAVFKYGFHMNPFIYFRRYLKFLLVLLSAGGICWLICIQLHFSIAINIILKIVICSVVPNGLFFLLYRRSEEFVYLKHVFMVLKRKIRGIITRVRH